MQAVSSFTKLTPLDRMKEIERKVGQLADGARKKGVVDIDPQTQYIHGHVLKAPVLKFGQQDVQPESGEFQLRQRINQPFTFKDWVIVYESRGKGDDETVDTIFDDFKRAGQTLGINFDEPGFITVNTNRFEDWKKEIQKDVDKNGIPQFIVTIMKKKDSGLYTRLKDYALRFLGVPHQNFCIQSL